MTDTEPGVPAPGQARPPARPPGPVPPGYLPREWVQAVPHPPAPPAPVRPTVAVAPGFDATGALDRPISPSQPFLDTPSVPPQSKRQAWVWLIYAGAGFLAGQIGALVFSLVAGAVAGKTSAQMQAIATSSAPPEWYVVSTLVGLWIGFFGAPWLASITQGTKHFFHDLGVRFRLIDLIGIAIGIGGQILVALLYAPFQHDIHNFNAPSQRLTGGSHGGGFVVIALATVILAPAMEELFFRGLLLKALVRLFTPLGAPPGATARVVGVVLAVIADGLLFGLAHGEWIQLAGLAVFGMVLAAVSYRTGRLGMNMVAHASFNLVAIIAIAGNGSVVLH